MKNLIKFYFLIWLFPFISCTSHKTLKPIEGYLQVHGGKVWYKIVGEGDKTPILLLHGGPGVPSYYLNPLAALSKDRPIIFLDQLGCGRSDRITDTSLLSVESFVSQLEEIRQQLELTDFYLYGQSWGTMLATDYYLKHPEGIKGLILSSPSLSIPLWLRDADILIFSLPDSIQQAIRTNEKNKTYDAPEYQRAMRVYYENFLARKLPWSPDIDSAFANMGKNVYEYMGGPSEFTMPGVLKDYDRTDRLSDIEVPTLFIVGEFDEARPTTVKYYQTLVPNSKYVMIKNAGHMTMQDNPEEDIKAISDFLNEIDKNQLK